MRVTACWVQGTRASDTRERASPHPLGRPLPVASVPEFGIITGFQRQGRAIVTYVGDGESMLAARVLIHSLQMVGSEVEVVVATNAQAEAYALSIAEEFGSRVVVWSQIESPFRDWAKAHEAVVNRETRVQRSLSDATWQFQQVTGHCQIRRLASDCPDTETGIHIETSMRWNECTPESLAHAKRRMTLLRLLCRSDLPARAAADTDTKLCTVSASRSTRTGGPMVLVTNFSAHFLSEAGGLVVVFGQGRPLLLPQAKKNMCLCMRLCV